MSHLLQCIIESLYSREKQSVLSSSCTQVVRIAGLGSLGPSSEFQNALSSPEDSTQPGAHDVSTKLWNMPLYAITEEQMEQDGFVAKLLFIIDGLKSSVERVLAPLPKHHPNFELLAHDLKRSYMHCMRSVSGPLPSNDVDSLERAITLAARSLRRAVKSTIKKYADFVDTADAQVCADVADIVNAYKVERRQHALSSPQEDPFRQRLAHEIVVKETHSSRKVLGSGSST